MLFLVLYVVRDRDKTMSTVVPRVAVRSVTKGIADVVLSSPNKLNMLDATFFDQLRQVFEEVDQNPCVKVAVLRAEGKLFTAGLDLKSTSDMFFGDISAGQKVKIAGTVALGKLGINVSPAITEVGMPAMRNQYLMQTIDRWQKACSSLEECRVPVIAAVHSKCIGGGVDIVTAADMRVCTKDATFCVKEVRVGITADLGTLARLSRIVGEGRAREYAYTARDIGADEALRVGLVNHVFEDEAGMQKGAMDLAASIAANAPMAVQGTKRVLNHAVETSNRRSLEFVRMWNTSFMKSDDVVEAMLAFQQKREPAFDSYVPPTPTKDK